MMRQRIKRLNARLVEWGIPDILIGVVLGVLLAFFVLVPSAYPEVRVEGHLQGGHLIGDITVDDNAVEEEGHVVLVAYLKRMVISPENENFFWFTKEWR